MIPAMTPGVAQGASRLMEALEKLGEWAGSGQSGSGPSGPPSGEAVRAFEEAMSDVPDAAEGEISVAAPTEPAAEHSLLPGPAESVPPLDGADLRMSGADPATPPNPENPANWGPGMERVDGADVAERAEPYPQTVESPEAVDAGGRTAPTGATEDPALRAEASGEENPVRELGRLLEEVSRPGASIGPEKLFRVQYLVGMLKVQVQTGLKTSQQASQGMESVLRQQG